MEKTMIIVTLWAFSNQIPPPHPILVDILKMDCSGGLTFVYT